MSGASTAGTLTKIKLELPFGADFVKPASKESGAVCELFNCFNSPKQSEPSNSAEPLRSKDAIALLEMFHPHPVWFRLNADINSPQLKRGFSELKKLKHLGFENFGIAFFGVRDFSEIYNARLLAAEAGVSLGTEIDFGAVIEYPASAMMASAFLKTGASFAIIDIDQLTKRMLFSKKIRMQIHPSVAGAIKSYAQALNAAKIHLSARGKMLEDNGVVHELVSYGIGSFVVPLENAGKIMLYAAFGEKKRELELLKTRMKMHICRKAFKDL